MILRWLLTSHHYLKLVAIIGVIAMIAAGWWKDSAFWPLIAVIFGVYLLPDFLELSHRRRVHVHVWIGRFFIVILVFFGFQLVGSVQTLMQQGKPISPPTVFSNFSNPLDHLHFCEVQSLDGTYHPTTSDPTCPNYQASGPIDPAHNDPLPWPEARPLPTSVQEEVDASTLKSCQVKGLDNCDKRMLLGACLKRPEHPKYNTCAKEVGMETFPWGN